MALILRIALALIFVAPWVRGQGTVFTYQGRLSDGNGPANGSYDFQFALMNAPAEGAEVGVTLTNSPVTIRNGLFTAVLDFGGGVFDGSARWLEIGVRSNGNYGAYTILLPRQALTATPYAVTAGNLTGLLPGGALKGSYEGAVVFNNGANGFFGTFAGDGWNLSNLDAASLSGGVIALERLPAAIVTNGYALPLAIGDSNGAHLDTVSSYSNVVVGAAATNSSMAGSSILFPDQGGIAWKNGATIYDWGDHNNGNELQIIVGHGATLAAYGGGQYGRGFQMGGSGPYHDKFWFQYDTAPYAPGLGFSKLVEFVTRSGTGNAYAYSAIRAVAADASSGMNTLNFYSGEPSAVDNSGANLMGTMLTNGWNFYGAVTVTNIALNSVTFMQTNTAPNDPLTPKLWIDVTNNGVGYKMPLYQ